MGRHETISSRDRVARHRAAMRAKGFRLKQMWVPDVTTPAFVAALQREAEIVNRADKSESLDWLDAMWVDALKDEPDYH